MMAAQFLVNVRGVHLTVSSKVKTLEGEVKALAVSLHPLAVSIIPLERLT